MSNYTNIQFMDQSNFMQNKMPFKNLLCLLFVCSFRINVKLSMSNLMK